ncbi:hypothetical protein Tco_0537289, partial [Tanacetum coccineum]
VKEVELVGGLKEQGVREAEEGVREAMEKCLNMFVTLFVLQLFHAMTEDEIRKHMEHDYTE